MTNTNSTDLKVKTRNTRRKLLWETLSITSNEDARPSTSLLKIWVWKPTLHSALDSHWKRLNGKSLMPIWKSIWSN